MNTLEVDRFLKNFNGLNYLKKFKTMFICYKIQINNQIVVDIGSQFMYQLKDLLNILTATVSANNPEIYQFFKENDNKWIYNKFPIQSYKSQSCRKFSILFIAFRSKGLSRTDFLNFI